MSHSPVEPGRQRCPGRQQTWRWSFTQPACCWVCVFVTPGHSTKMFAWGGEDMGGHVLRETTSRGLCGLGCPSRTSERGGEGDATLPVPRYQSQAGVFITAVPNTKLCAWGEEEWRTFMCYEICVCLLLQDLVQNCLHQIRRAYACLIFIFKLFKFISAHGPTENARHRSRRTSLVCGARRSPTPERPGRASHTQGTAHG
jgi:hypothetical protein